jgi:hypothetical protein
MTYLNKVHFYRRCKKGYWKGQQRRWDYISIVLNILREAAPRSVLEIGNCGLPLTSISDTMDLYKRFYRKKLTYHQSATKTPWNIPDKKYDFVIALQVFEHLDNKRIKQIDVFNECCRVGNNVIISIPFKWKFSKFSDHGNIDDSLILRWALQRLWYFEKVVGTIRKRKIYWWKGI